MKIKIAVIRDQAQMISKATEGASGYDVFADLSQMGTDLLEIPAHEMRLIPTGIKSEIEFGYEAVLRARSGISTKKGLNLINGVGTVDSDYRGEWKVPLHNTTNDVKYISHGERIAQVVFQKVEYPEIYIVSEDQIDSSERGDGGFGSTGDK